MKEKGKRPAGRGRRVLRVLAVVLVVLLAAAVLHLRQYYPATDRAQAALESDREVTVQSTDQMIFFDGPGEESAYIFYPGAKVEAAAYAPLMRKIAGGGTDVFVVRMPAHLALFGMNRAEGIMQKYTYNDWYLGGHSFGGAVAAMYAQKHPQGIRGLILLAAYPTGELDDDLAVLSMYGSEDGVLKRENLEKGRSYMPPDYTEYVITGGNHAYFGDYGRQKGDGRASITRAQQQETCAEQIRAFVRARE